MLLIPSHLRSTVCQDGAVILDTPNDTLTTLNSIGAQIWSLLQAGSTVDEIVPTIASLTGADTEVVRSDVREFVIDLIGRQLLTQTEM